MLAVAAAAAAGAAQGGVTATLRGVVRDSVGDGLEGAEVVLRDASDRRVAGTITDSEGRYVLLAVPAGGPYILVATRVGYAAVRRERLRLAAGEARRLDVVLAFRPVDLPGLEVTAAADEVFGGRRTGAVTIVEERAVETAPTVERTLVGLAALSPMVAVEGDAISVAGQNSRFNSLRVDGALSQDIYGLSPTGIPGGVANARALPLQAVRQYGVVVAPFDVRQSGFTGGLLNAVTRSGGDRWEGSAFAYYRGAAFSRTQDDSDVVRTYGRGATNEFRTEAGGFTAGGPVGAARVFVAAEVERRRRPLPGFHLGIADPLRVGLIEDSVARLESVLRDGYGFDPGSPAAYPLENPLGNVFARVDAPVGDRHDLTVRYNGISAAADVEPNRLGFEAYGMTSTGQRVESRTHAVSARLGSRAGPRTHNELLLNVQHTRDATNGSEQPLIEVSMFARLDSLLLLRRVRAGGEPLSHDSDLGQTVVQLADNVRHAVGDHLLTLGVDASWFGIRRRFLPGSRGIWRFSSVAALEANQPNSYERLVLLDGAEPDVAFSTLQLAGYVQDEWSVRDYLAVTFGLRADWPLVLSRPGYNRSADVALDVVTDRLPSSSPLLSPRVGVNWSPPGRRRTQVRGGIGLFTGLPPLAWIADAFASTGLRTGLLQCAAGAAPALDPVALPSSCTDGRGPGAPELAFFDDAFRYPQDVRASLAVDRELPWGLVATVEGVYTRSLHQVALEDLNLGAAQPEPSQANGFPVGLGGRPYFGTPVLVPGRFGPFVPGRRWDEWGQVIRVGNRSRNAALAVAAELQRRFSDRLDLRLAYTYTRSVDTRSLLYQDATLNYGLTPVARDPARPDPSPSAFDRPHRVLASVWAKLADWGDGLDASLLYIGQSGLPYSYVYETDMNGDGYPGPGALETAYNDLLYVPAYSSDIEGSIISRSLLFQLAAMEPCLQEFEGSIVARNRCRTPWANRLDVRVAQGVRLPIGSARLRVDLMNALNLLNPEWGRIYTAPPVVPVWNIDDRLDCPSPECSIGNPLIGRYVGPRRLNTDTGFPVAERPLVLSLPESQWRAQVGVELTVR